MPVAPDFKFNFSKGLNTEAGPFYPGEGYFKDGLNVMTNPDGSCEMRKGIEIVNSSNKYTIQDKSDATYLFQPSTFRAEFVKNDGTVFDAIIMRWGNALRIFTQNLESLHIGVPDYTFTLSDVSDEAWYYKTDFEQIGNAIIISNCRSPLYKLIWGDAGVTETFSVFKIELAEFNQELFELPRAVTIGPERRGYFVVEVPLRTGVISYDIFQQVLDPNTASIGYKASFFLVGTDGVVSSATAVYAESLNVTYNILTATVTYTATPVNGQRLRVYLGRNLLTEEDASLDREEIVISDQNKNFNADNTFSPRSVAAFAGRVWFAGVDGPLNEADANSYPDLERQPNKIWASELFPKTIAKEEISHLICHPDRSPLDIVSNDIVFSDGATYELDNAQNILSIAPYGSSLFATCQNGIWAITGPEEFFAPNNVIIKKVIDHDFLSREPLAVTDQGIIAFGENEVFWINPNAQQNDPITPLIRNTAFTKYNKVSRDAKKHSFTRYDKHNKRVYWFYPNDSDITASKYEAPTLCKNWAVFDLRTGAWTFHTTSGGWGVFDMTTIPSDSYFSAGDQRATDNQYVNLLTLGKKNGNYTDLYFGILEGNKYSDLFNVSSEKTAFESYIETFNAFALEGGATSIGSRKQVAKLYIMRGRIETDDADADGYYAVPGALYMSKRYRFADHQYAGPLYGYTYNTNTDTWDEDAKQIYFPNKLGSTVVGGGKPPFEVIMFIGKVRGSGNTLAIKFGNDYGNTTLTGTVEEQEKGWKLYGFELQFKTYKG